MSVKSRVAVKYWTLFRPWQGVTNLVETGPKGKQETRRHPSRNVTTEPTHINHDPSKTDAPAGVCQSGHLLLSMLPHIQFSC